MAHSHLVVFLVRNFHCFVEKETNFLLLELSWLECGTVNPEVTGSTPVGRASSFFLLLYCCDNGRCSNSSVII